MLYLSECLHVAIQINDMQAGFVLALKKDFNSDSSENASNTSRINVQMNVIKSPKLSFKV